ncbi:retrovirus-related pol polyprotein from transposon TNT 1-94 [Tanacetum coccineum]
MTTLADKAILSGADNRPPMLEKDMYDSWKSIMELYMMNRQHGRMILESVENGPLIWPSIEENGVTRPKKYSELSATEAIQADCDIKATNIILQGLPPEVYALVSNHKVAKELWERIQLLMQGTSLTKQERECKLYDEFDKFAYKKGETLRDFYLRFSLLLNDMNIYNMKLEQFQVNTKFLNTLPPEWSKFVTDVKLVRDLHTTNIDQLHAYLGQHEFHANEVHLMHERNSDPLALVVTHQMTQSPYQTHQHSYQNSQFQQQVSLYQSLQYGSPYQSQQYSSNQSSTPLSITYPSNDYQSLVHHNAYSPPSSIPQIEYAPIETVQNSNSSAQQDALILSMIEQLKTQVVNCNKTNLDNKSVNDTLTAELERYEEQVKVMKEGQNIDLKSKDNISDSCAQSVEIDHLKQTLSEHLKEKESLMQTVTLLKNDFKKEESRNIDREIALEKRIKQLDNIKAQQLEPKLYDGNVIKNTSAIVIPDSEETLMLAEESRSKMLLKQKDPIMLEKKVNTTPVDYAVLNQLSQDFETRFVPQTELSAEQAFWSQNSMNSPDPTLSSRPTKVEVPKELPKVSMVNTSLKKLKHHLAGFDVVVKERTTATAITEGSWGFEHTKACFRDEIIPFVKALKDLFNTFDQYLIDELSEVQNVFHQMEQAVEQHRLESKTFEVKMNKVLNENERLLEQIISKDIVNIIVNSSVDNTSVYVHECEKCLKLETELLNKKDFIEKETYDKLFRSFTTLEKHCISLEVDSQLNQEIFQRDNSVSNQSAPSFDQYFELNELKAQSQEKDTVIKKLKERIKSLSGNMNGDTIKKDLEKIETINIELDHRVSKLIAENEHLKQTYNLHEKVLVIIALKDDLRKLKGKALVDNAVTKHTIDPEMLKIDVKPITPKLLNKRTTHSAYIKHTQEEAVVFRDLVDHVKANYPLDHSLESAYRYTKLIQELLINISKTCRSINNSGERLVAVTPKNKDKIVRFTKPVTSLGNTVTKIASTSNLVSNKPMLSSTGVKPSTSTIESQPSGNTKKDKIQQTPRTTNVQHSKLNANSDNHDLYVLDFINNVNARVKSKSVKKVHREKITTTTEVPLRKPTALENETPKPVITLVYSRKPRKSKTNVLVSKSKVLKSVSANKKEPSQSWGSIVSDVPSSSLDECRSSKLFSGTVKFGNDHVAKILGYGDYQIGNVMISRVYYVEGLGHNLFSVGQFCDSNLEVAFRQHTCFIRNLEGVDLLTGSRGNNLYTLSLRDMMASSPICLLSKASKTKSWLWHRRLSHLNFGAINHLARHGLVRGLPKLKFEKDHLCSACAMGKSKKKPHKPKSEDTNQEKLYLLHMDLCGPMRVASVNGKKYILVIVDLCRENFLELSSRFNNESVYSVSWKIMMTFSPDMSLFKSLTTYVLAMKPTSVLIRTLVQSTILANTVPCSRSPLSKILKRTICVTTCANGEKQEETPYKSKSEDTNQENSILMHMRSLWTNALFATPEAIAPIADEVAPKPAATPVHLASTTVDQDPSPSNSQTTPETRIPNIPNRVEEGNQT